MVAYWHLRGLVNEGRRYLGEVVTAVGPASPAAVGALNGLSWLSWAQGDIQGAARHARAAFRAARRGGDRRGVAYSLLRLAQARFDGARPAEASRATAHVERIATELGDERLTAECVLLFGQIALVEGRLEDAERLLPESVRLLSLTRRVDREATALLILGRLYLRQKSTEAAEATLLRSFTALHDFALVRHSVPILESLAAVAADRGDNGRAALLAGGGGVWVAPPWRTATDLVAASPPAAVRSSGWVTAG
jgi:tetratricopeptide (TPR) repeat protein